MLRSSALITKWIQFEIQFEIEFEIQFETQFEGGLRWPGEKMRATAPILINNVNQIKLRRNFVRFPFQKNIPLGQWYPLRHYTPALQGTAG